MYSGFVLRGVARPEMTACGERHEGAPGDPSAEVLREMTAVVGRRESAAEFPSVEVSPEIQLLLRKGAGVQPKSPKIPMLRMRC